MHEIQKGPSCSVRMCRWRQRRASMATGGRHHQGRWSGCHTSIMPTPLCSFSAMTFRQQRLCAAGRREAGLQLVERSISNLLISTALVPPASSGGGSSWEPGDERKAQTLDSRFHGALHSKCIACCGLWKSFSVFD